MRAAKSILLVIASLISGCTTTLPENSFCQLAEPIYFDKADHVSERTKEEVYKHFKTGQELCGWPTV